MSGELTMVRGVVAAAREQMQSVRVDRQTGHGQINTTPELWIRDENGKEHRYQGAMFDGAQPGHQVAIIIKVASGKPMAFANFTTELVRDSKELTINTSIGANLFSALFISLLAALPGYLVWATLLSTIGLGDHAFSATAFQIYAVILVACVYSGLTVWSKRYRERSSALREEVDRLLAAGTPQQVGHHGR